jgi:hypothetical protein
MSMKFNDRSSQTEIYCSRKEEKVEEKKRDLRKLKSIV